MLADTASVGGAGVGVVSAARGGVLALGAGGVWLKPGEARNEARITAATKARLAGIFTDPAPDDVVPGCAVGRSKSSNSWPFHPAGGLTELRCSSIQRRPHRSNALEPDEIPPRHFETVET